LEYSQQILDLIPTNEVGLVPLPKLAPLFRGLCWRYCKIKDPAFAMAAEALIDGVDLDEGLCRMHVGALLPKELKFALKLARALSPPPSTAGTKPNWVISLQIM